MSDPLLFSLVQDLEFQTGFRIKQVVSTRGDILESLSVEHVRRRVAVRATVEAADRLEWFPQARAPAGHDGLWGWVAGGKEAVGK